MLTSCWSFDPYLEAVLGHLALRNNLDLYINHVIDNSNCSHLTPGWLLFRQHKIAIIRDHKGNKVFGQRVNHNQLSRELGFRETASFPYLLKIYIYITFHFFTFVHMLSCDYGKVGLIFLVLLPKLYPYSLISYNFKISIRAKHSFDYCALLRHSVL